MVVLTASEHFLLNFARICPTKNFILVLDACRQVYRRSCMITRQVSSVAMCNRDLKINDAATQRRGVNMYDTKKVFWNLMSVTTV